MAERVVTEEVEEKPRDTVVVKEGGSNAGWIIFAVIAFLILLYLFMGNPFAGTGTDTNVDVNMPTPAINDPTPTPPSE